MNTLRHYITHYFEINEDECDAIAGLFKTQTLSRNDFYLKTGKICDKLSFINSGMLRIFVNLPDKEVTQWIATSGYFVTDLSGFLFGTKCRWNIQALSDCSLFTINHDDYDDLANHISKWNDIERLFIGKCFVTLENRVLSQISLSSEERYDLLFDQQRDLFNQVPLQYLASMLGMTPETFSRIRGKKNS